MKFENQFVSVEFAKKLKELGVPQKSLWYWYKYHYDKQWFIGQKQEIAWEENPECYSAFTADEIAKIFMKSLKNGEKRSNKCSPKLK